MPLQLSGVARASDCRFCGLLVSQWFGKFADKTPASDRKALLATIGELTFQNDLFAQVLSK